MPYRDQPRSRLASMLKEWTTCRTGHAITGCAVNVGRVFLHPASFNFDCGEFPSGWMVYTDLTETSKVFVREASMVPIYALLLFGGALTVHHMEGHVKLDNWATFKAPAQIATLVGVRSLMWSLQAVCDAACFGLQQSRIHCVNAMKNSLRM